MYSMCLEVLRNPTKAILNAKKRNQKKTFMVMLENSILLALATGIVVAKTGLIDLLLVGSIVAVFLAALISMMLFGLVTYVTTTTLGGKGKYLEGLTATSFALAPVAAGIFILSLLAWVPYTLGIQVVVLALTFALGMSMLHRAIKELYKTDMVVSFISVSISVLALLLAIYVSVGFSLLGRLAAGVL